MAACNSLAVHCCGDSYHPLFYVFIHYCINFQSCSSLFFFGKLILYDNFELQVVPGVINDRAKNQSCFLVLKKDKHKK